MENKYLIFYDKILPVQGYTKSIICDMQYGKMHPIPNSMYYILQEFEKKSIEEVKNQYNEKENLVVDEYIKLLIESKFCFVGDSFDKDILTQATDKIELPSQITNCVLDFTESSTYELAQFITQLDDLGCIGVQLRFFFSPNFERLSTYLKEFADTRIENIEILIADSSNYSIDALQSLLFDYPRLDKIVLHSSQEDDYITTEQTRKHIVKTKSKITSEKCCGSISFSDFSPTTLNYSENKYQNSCLHKKISVDSKGQIGNCPAMMHKYGQISEVNLSEIIKTEKYKELSTISKDSVDKCKDCEYRYACSDCRVFTENNDLYGKPSKCAYDPYTGAWA